MIEMNTDNDSFIDIIAFTLLVSIDLIVQNPKQEILLGKRVNKPAQGFWFVPGGRIYKNETIRNAIKRISQTEIGVDLSDHDPGLPGATEHMYNDNFLNQPDVSTHYVVLVFVIELENEIMYSPDDQHSGMKWWTVEELLSDNTVHPNIWEYFKP
jgi:colanic acid biosynthesis protein WcaH